jgi:hypothetical protein
LKHRDDKKQLRQFGLLVGGIFAAIGLWPVLVRAEVPRLWALALGVALVVPALVLPRSLIHVHRAWMAAAEALGWINTRILLSVIFYGLMTPMGIVMRRRRRDPMQRRFDPGATTYRVPKPSRPAVHMTRQF